MTETELKGLIMAYRFYMFDNIILVCSGFKNDRFNGFIIISFTVSYTCMWMGVMKLYSASQFIFRILIFPPSFICLSSFLFFLIIDMLIFVGLFPFFPDIIQTIIQL